MKKVWQHRSHAFPPHYTPGHNWKCKTYSWSVVGLGLGGRGKTKQGALWWRHHTQPIVIITFDLPKIRSPKDVFLRLRHDWNSRRKCKSVFMIHNFKNTESWESWQHVGIALTSLVSRPISLHSPSINYKVYPFESFTPSPFEKCLVVGILNLSTFMSLWKSMKPKKTTIKM